MNTGELLSLGVYVAALIVLSAVFHRRYRCIRASAFTGFLAAFLAISILTALHPGALNPLNYISGFIWFGITPALVGAALSALVGIPIQLRKMKNEPKK
jgi:hypothetical protein